jgi:type III pantothenate kinase
MKNLALVVDIGNTNISLCLTKANEMVELDLATWKRITSKNLTKDELQILLINLFGTEPVEKIAYVLVSSGVKSIEKTFFHWSETIKAKWFSLNHNNANIETKYGNPNEIGSDRLANSLEFWGLYKVPGVVIDFGTATTFDVIDNSGAYCGGIIFPGIETSLSALYEKAPALKNVDLHKVDEIVATSTADALRSGIFSGYASMIDGVIKKISNKSDVERVVITGGLGDLICEGVEVAATYDEHITVRGILRAALADSVL